MSDNAVATVLTDAEKIAEELCPPVAAVPRVVGVLIKQVEQLAKTTTGKEIEALAEDVLGIAPPSAEGGTSAEGTDPAVQAKLNELQAEIDALKAASSGAGA